VGPIPAEEKVDENAAMRTTALETLAGLPYFAAFFGLSLLLLAGCLALYVAITPYPEIRLIREGNVAAAISLGGAIIGFALPLASVVVNSVSLLDMLLWSAVALLVQLVAFAGVRLMVPAISRNVREGQVSSAIVLGSLAVALGILNAASMTY
jgi:putative membrane protein